MSSRKDGDTMNRLMRVTLLTFVVSLVVWGLIAVWDADPRALTSWMLTWQRIAVYVATVSGLVMLALLVYAAWERLRR
jgi:threonine/homoserine/homoserine lactone efflux protein